jgi:RNA polymerase-binding transcription factor DksA
MSNLDLGYFKEKIINEIEKLREALLRHDDYIKKNITSETGDLSSYDNHPAELASETYELSKELTLKKHFEDKISDLKKALEKIEKGGFGLCDICKKEISFERLDALPNANLCTKCKTEKMASTGKEQSDDRNEESLLDKPLSYQEAFFEDSSYNGEDVWQELQLYGSSSGPQDFITNDNLDYNSTYYKEHNNKGIVEEIEGISNKEYEEQLPVNHYSSYRDYDVKEKKNIDYDTD